MRLTTLEQQTIRDAALRHFGARARLFGSRVDDSKRGGDIDLYIEAQLSPEDAFAREMNMAADLYLALGERKIDIVVNHGYLELPIYAVARQQGVWL
jgi:predicted nucleotidyltransferase